ncbi:MAG: transcription termination/antitermination factor NusG [Elusimicrobia bacterium]|nr:transcription termination/antitermination factor NusG [Elusimicrobiota bacterium]
MSVTTRAWHIVQTTTGREERVRGAILKAKETNPAGERIFQVLIPTEDVVQIQKNKKVVRKRKFFPGYVLIDMVVDNETYWLIRSINGVSGFLGGSNPVPLPESEVKAILELTETNAGSRPKPAVMFAKGESIRINEGPFKHFVGIVEEVNEEKARLKAMVTIFGRATPVELDFLQVEKI